MTLIIFSKNLIKPELAVFDIFIYLFTFLKLDKTNQYLETLKISSPLCLSKQLSNLLFFSLILALLVIII